MIARLGRGRDAAVTYGELAERLGIPRRSVEEAIRLARHDLHPIVTGNEGAWLAETPQEARRAAQALRDRAIHQMETAQALDRAADAMEMAVQPTLWEAA